MRFLRLLLLIAALIHGAAGQAQAQAQASTDSWLLRGFGTLSATRTDDAGTGYLSYPQNIARASGDEWSLANDSLLGMQLDILPDQTLSATA